MDPFAYLVILAGLMALFSFLAGYLPLRRKWSKGTMKLFVAFGGGALLAAAFLLIIPESMALMAGESHGHSEGESGADMAEHEEEEPPFGWDLWLFFGVAVLHGFMFMLVVENFGILHDLHEEECEAHTFGMVAFLGLTMHTFIDGVALGAAARTEDFATLGLVIFIAIVSHKMPSSFTLGSILLSSGYKRPRVAQLVGVFSVMVVAGAVVSYLIFENLADLWLGAILAFSAGTFIYVSAVDVLPEMHHEATSRYKSVAALVAGTLVMLVFAMIGGH